MPIEQAHKATDSGLGVRGFEAHKKELLGKLDDIEKQRRAIFPVDMQLQTLEMMVGATAYAFATSGKKLEPNAREALDLALTDVKDGVFEGFFSVEQADGLLQRQAEKIEKMRGKPRMREETLAYFKTHRNFLAIWASRGASNEIRQVSPGAGTENCTKG